MRRGVGIQGLQRQAQKNEQFKQVGSALEAKELNEMKAQLDLFRENLAEFASKHRKDIARNPEFRMQFQKMCAQIGVDPLASTKGFWSELLGVGDFYYELAVQIIEVCLRTRSQNGGLIAMEDLMQLLRARRGKHAQEISEDDIARAIKSVRALGNGFAIVSAGPRRMVQSVPRELNTDHYAVLTIIQAKKSATVEALVKELSWTEDRVRTTLDQFLKDGILWIDQQSSPPSYWLPTTFSES